MGHLHERNQWFRDIGNLIEVCHNLFSDTARNAFPDRFEGLEGPVLVIGRLIQQRAVDARDLRCPFEELQSGRSFPPALLIEIKQVLIYGLAFSDIKQIKEIRDRFRIIRAGTSADHNRRSLPKTLFFLSARFILCV